MANKLLNVLIFLLYWALFVWVAMPQGMQTELEIYRGFAHFTPAASNHDLINLFGGADIASYARGAWDIYKHHGRFSTDGYWFMNLWAPGFFWVQAKLIKLLHLGAHKPVVVWLVVLTCGTWAAVMAEAQRLLRQRMHPVVAFIWPLLLLLSTLFRQHFLASGAVMTESISTACVLLAALLSLRAAQQQRISLALLSGVWLAIGAYLRAQVELFGGGFTLIIVAVVLGFLVFSKAYRGSFNPHPAPGLQPVSTLSPKGRGLGGLRQWAFWPTRFGAINLLLLTLLVFHGLTLPYRLYTQQRTGSMAWNQSNYVWRFHWKTAQELRATGAGFYADGGMTTACDLSPQLCATINRTTRAYGKTHPGADPNAVFDWTVYRNDAIKTFLHHPLKWLAHKASYMPPHWMGDVGFPANLGWAFWENSILALCVLGFGTLNKWQWWISLIRPAAIFSQREKGYGVEMSPWIYASSLILTTLVFFCFVQIEPRYYFQLKITAAFVMLLFAASFLPQRRQPSF